MTETETQFDEQKIKRYLFAEMTDEEVEAMEEEIIENDELFVEIAQTENHLIDLYARRKLTGEELARFERSLEKVPGRRAKTANAVVLQNLIADERPSEKEEVPAAAGQTFWQKISNLFAVPALGFSMAALLLLLALTSLILFIDNRDKRSEIAELQNGRQGGWEQKQKELEEKLAAVNERVEDLQKQSETQGREGDRIFGELESVSEEKERLESELEKLRKEKSLTPTPKQPAAPTIATFLLTPSISTRGGSAGATRNLSVSKETRQISVRLVLPEDVDRAERFSVKLNEKTIASNLAGQKSLQVKFAADELSEGLNKLAVTNAEGKEISKYIFNMQKK